MPCSGSAGYQGYLLANGFILPYLSADLSQVTKLNMSESMHGGGAGNTNPVFRSKTNFAIGQQTVAGTVAVEVFGGSGNYASAFTQMLNRAMPSQTDDTNVCTGFNTANPLIFSPGGGSEIVVPSAGAANGKCLVNTLEIRGNPGGNVQCSFSIVGAGADYNNTNAHVPTASQLAFEPIQSTDDNNPVPYYASNFNITGSGESSLVDRITDWNVTINNNVIPIYTFDGKNYAQDIILGMLQVTGSFSYYSSTGTFVQNLTHGAVGSISFGGVIINMPYIAFTSMNTPPSPGPNAPTIRTIQFECIAAAANLPAIYHTP